MAHFSIEQITEQSDRINVKIDHCFNIVIERTEDGLDLHIYPLTQGEIWDAHFKAAREAYSHAKLLDHAPAILTALQNMVWRFEDIEHETGEPNETISQARETIAWATGRPV